MRDLDKGQKRPILKIIWQAQSWLWKMTVSSEAFKFLSFILNMKIFWNKDPQRLAIVSQIFREKSAISENFYDQV